MRGWHSAALFSTLLVVFACNAEVVDALRDASPRLPPAAGSDEGLATRVLRRMSYDDTPMAGG